MPPKFRDIWRIRKGAFESLDFLRDSIMNFIVSDMRLQADRLCAPYNNRVGVFGSYPNMRKTVIGEVARTISESGFGVVSDLGFLEPNSPEKLHSIEELLSPSTKQTIEDFQISDYTKHCHLPRIACKAVHNLTILGQQENDPVGCFRWKMPKMGFIIDEQIEGLEHKPRLCSYLKQGGFYWECFARARAGKGFCFYLSLRQTCPFHDYADIPSDVKHILMERKNRLIACKSLENLRFSVIECLKTKMKKPTA